MVRFSCFFTPNHNQRSKKIQQLDLTMHKKIQDQENVLSGSPSTKTDDNNLSSNNVENITSPSSHEDCWKSDDLNINSDLEDKEEFHMRMRMKKSQSLGCILDVERDSSGGEVTDDDEIDGGFSFNHSYQKSMIRMNGEGLKTSFNIQNEEKNDLVESFDMNSGNANHESIFSIEALQQFNQDRHANRDQQSPDHVMDSACLSSDTPPALERSQSVSNLRVDPACPTEDTMSHEVMRPQSRSFQNLHFVNGGMAEFPDGDDVTGSGVNLHHEGFDSDNKSTDAYDSHNCNAVANVGSELETDDAKLRKFQQKSLTFDKLNPKEFSIRRIQDWISQIDIESVVEEPGESSASFSIKEPQMESDVPNTKPDAKSHLGMEVASNYMKSLTATSSIAQMTNLGLVAVPFLSAFVGIRVLNLSGNAIVRITAGALPRGLHMLNLSKNNIAVIEGLRDLTRLRVLDLSYNRIIRIGHGLASCSSLKELYLAGNKISEVEGLHRLLKLNVLDLRSNKISTAKGLGQLAANYGSLQSVNLDGNPAQRNVGDEQLKKYLLSLLPNLGYYNKQAIRSSGTKDISDKRASALHFDRNKRPEQKLPRRGSHGSGLHKLSVNPVRSKHALGSSSKSSRIRNVEFRNAPLPPIGGSKVSYPLPGPEKKPVSLQASNPIRRVRSEGTL